MDKMIKSLVPLAEVLVIVGAINWGLALFGVNLVEMLLGGLGDIVMNIVYGAVGISGLLIGAIKLKLLR